MITSVPLRERKKAATKERIYLEAIELFRQKGFAATTVDEIIAAAEVSKGTFFNYFPGKEALLHYFGERQTAAAAEAIAPALQDATQTAQAKLRLVFRTAAHNMEGDRDVARVVVFEVLKSSVEAMREPSRAVLRQVVAALVAEGQRKGEVRKTINAELAASALVGVYFQQIFEWCAADKPYPLAKRIDQLIDVLWNGLSA